LDGGPDGLRVIRQVIGKSGGWLNPGGWLALEVDAGQGTRIKRLLKAGGFRKIEIRRDFQGLERFAIAQFAGIAFRAH
jgi:release factor glutamine methyltransferase